MQYRLSIFVRLLAGVGLVAAAFGAPSPEFGAAAIGLSPMAFECSEASGGESDETECVAKGRGYSLRLDRQGAEYVFVREGADSTSFRVSLEDSSPVAPRGRQRSAGHSSYFLGSDPGGWRTRVPHFGKVRYSEVYPKIDWELHGTRAEPEFDFVLAPGADAGLILLRYEGVESLSLEDDGSLSIAAGGAVVTQRPPVGFQPASGAEPRRAVEARYRLLAGNRVGFVCGDYDRERELVIDPILVFSTYFGAEFGEAVYGVAIGADESIYVVGQSKDIPSTPGALTPPGDASFDIFVAKLSPDGRELIYNAVLGGADRERGNAIAVDPDGNVYVTGFTFSFNFPITAGAPQAQFGGGTRDAIVFKINPDGSRLVYSTYLGGSAFEDGWAIDIDGSGAAYVAGGTGAANFPTTAGAFQPAASGIVGDAFVTKVAADGRSLAWSTYLGGANREEAHGLRLRPSGEVVVAGYTRSLDFPVSSGAFQTQPSFIDDGFITEISADGARMIRSTFLGGSSEDRIQALTLDGEGDVYVTGRTRSPDMPATHDVPQPEYAGGNFYGDAFVARLDATLTALKYFSYLGGFSDDEGNGIGVDAQGKVIVAGSTGSRDFPVTSNALQSDWQSLDEVFIAQLSADGSELEFSSFLGGGEGDRGFALAVKGLRAVIGGNSSSFNFPTTPDSIQPRLASPREGGDAVILRIDFPPEPVFSRAAVVNAASGIAGSVAPGELLSIFGKDLGPTPALAAMLDETGGVAVNVGAVRVTFDGVPAPLLFVSAAQINLAAPFALAGRVSTEIQVHYEGSSSAPVSVPVASVAPGLFTLNGRGMGPGAVLNQNGTVNSASNPALPGSIIILFGTGAGQTVPEGFDGRLAAAPLARPRAFVVVRVAGIEAEVLYAGVASGLVEGTIQVNARIAATVGAGNTVPVELQVGNAASQAGVTIAVSDAR